ncbi:MAG: thioredoxin family protein [Melioribacteraceae bacterium]|nr:thioredoxin family protein [Melioribacteraceae bacterium]MCF8264350.1 thioredoxin family protein [Melioribacteraceae bacterium]
MKLLLKMLFVIILSAQLFGQAEEYVEGKLLSEVKTIEAGKQFTLAVKLKMEDHWHIYWRNVGDTGLPTTIDWTLPEGFEAGEINWPYPESFDFGGLINLGYENEAVLLVDIKTPDVITSDQITIKAEIKYLACYRSCIPGKEEIEIILPVGNEIANTELAEEFADARSKIPISSNDWKIEAATNGEILNIFAANPSWFEGEINKIKFFPYSEELIAYAPEQKLEKLDNGYILSIELSEYYTGENQNIEGVLVTDSGWRGEGSEKAMEIKVTLSDEIQSAEGGSVSGSGLMVALLFAFLGGIILNLMPCVLPVLSLKIMGLVQQAGEDKNKSLKHGLVFTLGVLVSFWILSGLLLLLRAGGEQLGWGFQLQSPEFVIVLSLFLFLFGLSMFGVFEIGASLTAVGGKAQNKSGFGGSFLSGVLATVVATPCTAPFMGSALGFALSQPAIISLLIFTFLGLGMASPYVLLSASPKLLKFVPKPGAWMETLKQFMGFLLFATVLWLLWVLSLQTGSMGVLILLFSFLISSLGAWILGKWGNLSKGKAIRTIAMIIALFTFAAGFYIALDNIELQTENASVSKSQGKIEWQNFSPELVTKYLEEGKPVFIDFTAAWCLSCQVNERVAFGSEEVQDYFVENGIQTIKADWTNRNETITKALAEFGRNSVPLYVYYDGKGAEPILLPEVITPGIVLDAIK